MQIEVTNRAEDQLKNPIINQAQGLAAGLLLQDQVQDLFKIEDRLRDRVI